LTKLIYVYSIGAYFLTYSANFLTVLSKSQNTPTHLMPSIRQILAQKWQFSHLKVIYFDVIEKPLSDYVLQYNTCGLLCEMSEDIGSEGSENHHFQRSHSYLTLPFQRPPRMSA